VVRCKRIVEVAEGTFKTDPVFGGPEYETAGALGSNCGVGNLEAVAKGNAICNAEGLDTIGGGMMVSFAMECFENGLITAQDTGGIQANFGNAEAMVQLLEMTVAREGIGDLLAQGYEACIRAWGPAARQFAIEVKGQPLPMHEPRYKFGLGLGYAISPTGADHCHNIHDNLFSGPSADLEDYKALGILEPLDVKDLSPAKVRLFKYYHQWRHFLNCAVMCQFNHFNLLQMPQLVQGVTGWNSSVWELMKVGERSVTMARAFNIREGLTRKDDYLPQRFLTAFTGGPLQGVAVDGAKLEQAKEVYYRMMGWEELRGAPRKETLAELGIGWVADLLQ
jgi:aldehyde:ferredoxin oxidoreductase